MQFEKHWQAWRQAISSVVEAASFLITYCSSGENCSGLMVFILNRCAAMVVQVLFVDNWRCISPMQCSKGGPCCLPPCGILLRGIRYRPQTDIWSPKSQRCAYQDVKWKGVKLKGRETQGSRILYRQIYENEIPLSCSSGCRDIRMQRATHFFCLNKSSVHIGLYWIIITGYAFSGGGVNQTERSHATEKHWNWKKAK